MKLKFAFLAFLLIGCTRYEVNIPYANLTVTAYSYGSYYDLPVDQELSTKIKLHFSDVKIRDWDSWYLSVTYVPDVMIKSGTTRISNEGGKVWYYSEKQNVICTDQSAGDKVLFEELRNAAIKYGMKRTRPCEETRPIEDKIYDENHTKWLRD